ncbi:MAG: class I SAM-dependent RNA methyltransferase, partial [Oscillospiraceae bacterium]|nr:class I SAM-dependent RNA methyltransferase [Oscillospiraceae bacterium]
MDFKLCVPCLLGLEGPIADELKRLKLDNVAAENGRVYFTGGAEAIAKANINLRIGERVLIELGKFDALSFDDLFEGTKSIPWEMLIPKDGAFPVKGYSLNSKLFSISDCQKIIKKAIVERLKKVYGMEWFSETGPEYQIRFSIMKDQVSMCIDTTGDGLHKRGYRPAHNVAPLKETIAAAMVTLSRYRGRDDFCDPFCGSGTIPIEAALIAKNRAPGLNRSFSAMNWNVFDKKVWQDVKDEARSREFNGNYNSVGSDIDPKTLAIARENAQRAGVADIVRFEQADACKFERKTQGGVIVTNPPYGERIMEKQEAEMLYRGFGAAYANSENWKLYLLSSHT